MEQKVVDGAIKDSQYNSSLQSFLIELDESQDLSVGFDVISKRIIDNVEPISLTSLDNYSNYTALSENNEKLDYYISDPMYMRGVRIVQIAVDPYIYERESRQLVLYDDINLRINIESSGDHIGNTNSKPFG